jgi:hypothetical protein
MGAKGTRARCVGYKPTNTTPCPRVGYPALGAGHARDRGGFVHQFSTSIAPYATTCRSPIRRCLLSLLICSTRSLSRSCSTSGTSHHGHKMQEGSFTRTIGTSTRNSRRPLTMHGHECVGFFALTLILFHFNIYFILLYFNIALFCIILKFLVNANQFILAETPL